MKVPTLKDFLAAGIAASATCLSGGAAAQDEQAAADASAAAPAPAKKATPLPAEIAPLASKNLLLGIADSGKRLVAVGARGTIITSDDGLLWKQVAVPVRATLTAVAFADADHGWAIGHDSVVLRTDDGGEHWKLQNFDAEAKQPFLSLLVLDAQHAYASGAFGLLRATDDGGATWTEVDAPAVREEKKHLNAIVRLGDGSLFIAGEGGMIAVSSAGGRDWKALKLPYEGSLFGALSFGARGAIVFGLRGNVFLSDDVRAQKWTKIDIGSQNSLFGAGRLPNGDTALVGADGQTVLLDSAGKVSKAEKVKAAGTPETGSYSAVVAWQKRLLAVGEQGIVQIQLLN